MPASSTKLRNTSKWYGVDLFCFSWWLIRRSPSAISHISRTIVRMSRPIDVIQFASHPLTSSETFACHVKVARVESESTCQCQGSMREFEQPELRSDLPMRVTSRSSVAYDTETEGLEVLVEKASDLVNRETAHDSCSAQFQRTEHPV